MEIKVNGRRVFFSFLPFRSKEEKMIDSQVVLQTTCFVPEWWRTD